jgi:hypothetical protein
MIYAAYANKAIAAFEKTKEEVKADFASEAWGAGA